MNRQPFIAPTQAFYRLQRLAREMNLLTPAAQREKAKQFFSEARRFLEKEEPCKSITTGRE